MYFTYDYEYTYMPTAKLIEARKNVFIYRCMDSILTLLY